MVDGDRRDLRANRRRPAAPPFEVRDVQRDRLRLGRQPCAADPVGDGRRNRASRPHRRACSTVRTRVASGGRPQLVVETAVRI